MGAQEFTAGPYKAKTVEAAHKKAMREARDRNGHRDGYSGDIQTTTGYIMVTPSAGESPQQCIDRLMGDDNSGIEKWKNCGVIKTPEGYVFFGWGAC